MSLKALKARSRFGASWVDEFGAMRRNIENFGRSRIAAGTVADIATADATDTATAEALANALKASYNGLLAALRTSKVLNTTALTAITDNSTGDASGNVPVAVNTATAFTHVNAASDLALTTAVNTALGKVDDALAVLEGNVAELTGRLGLLSPTANATGTVATAGTVPALDLTVTGTAGATAVAADRALFNAQVSVARNNMATLLRAFNNVAVAVGADTLLDATNGDADILALTLDDETDVATSRDNTGDAVSKADADAFFTAMGKNIAVLAAKITALKTTCATMQDLAIVP